MKLAFDIEFGRQGEAGRGVKKINCSFQGME